jgi:two-component system chemotaxis response regulator CheY
VERIVRTCLLVDDSAVIRKVAERVLDGLGLAVVEAEDGAQAIAACQRRMPDVAIVDSLMGEMDGYEVVRELRRLPDGGRPKVIISVVESDVGTIARVLHAGADSYLMKPFTGALVREKLEEVGILEAPPAEAAA